MFFLPTLIRSLPSCSVNGCVTASVYLRSAGDALRLVDFRLHRLTNFLACLTSPPVCACLCVTGWVTLPANKRCVSFAEAWCHSSTWGAAMTARPVVPSVFTACSASAPHTDRNRWWSWNILTPDSSGELGLLDSETPGGSVCVSKARSFELML